MNSPEAAVVHSLKQHLLQDGLRQGPVSNVIVDAHPSYIASSLRSKLEPMACLRIGSCQPDILCQVQRQRTQSVIGFEVKPHKRDWKKGLIQAHTYRPGVHNAYLALPGDPGAVKTELGTLAESLGVGIMVRHERNWLEVVEPPPPTPTPEYLFDSYQALQGAATARRLQLNHPLNYLIVPFLARRQNVTTGLLEVLRVAWLDLKSDGTRIHAIEGARSLGLINHDGSLTIEGRTAADLLQAVGFDPSIPTNKRARLGDERAAIAAIARFVFLRQPAAQLIIKSLEGLGGSATMPKLAEAACLLDAPLASTVFLANPSQLFAADLQGSQYNASVVFKLKQNMWHCGLLASKAHPTAGGNSADYRPELDEWRLGMLESG